MQGQLKRRVSARLETRTGATTQYWENTMTLISRREQGLFKCSNWPGSKPYHFIIGLQEEETGDRRCRWFSYLVRAVISEAGVSRRHRRPRRRWWRADWCKRGTAAELTGRKEGVVLFDAFSVGEPGNAAEFHPRAAANRPESWPPPHLHLRQPLCFFAIARDW
jgi:hypothetical protein